MPATVVTQHDIERLVERLLVCPDSHQPLTVQDGVISCAASGFQGAVKDGVVLMMDEQFPSFFDDKFHIMQQGHEDHGEWNFCYAEQVRLLERHLKPGMVVVDVGCGPSLPYDKNGAFVMGLEPSYPSVRNNLDLDLRIMGSATKMPFPAQSLDMVVCFYAIHHFVGINRQETQRLVTSAFQEFVRVIKPGGALFVYEMVPMAPAVLVQRMLWDLARKVLADKLDMHFWAAEFFDQMRSGMAREVILERVYFQSNLSTVIRPAFSLPQLKLYRFLYPLTPKLFKFLF